MINTRATYFFVILAIFVLTLIGLAVYYHLRSARARKYPYGEWDKLLKRLAEVDRDGIAWIARDRVDDYGNPQENEIDTGFDPTQISLIVGGLKGLETLERNCSVLVDLAFYVQQWYPEALIVAEDLRLNAREIQWHVDRLKGAAKAGTLDRSFADYGQRAVVTYYLMTRRVLALYEQLNVPGLAELQQAL